MRVIATSESARNRRNSAFASGVCINRCLRTRLITSLRSENPIVKWKFPSAHPKGLAEDVLRGRDGLPLDPGRIGEW